MDPMKELEKEVKDLRLQVEGLKKSLSHETEERINLLNKVNRYECILADIKNNVAYMSERIRGI